MTDLDFEWCGICKADVPMDKWEDHLEYHYEVDMWNRVDEAVDRDRGQVGGNLGKEGA